MSEATSYRQILRSSSIIGGSSAVNIVVGLARTKVAAVLLGPAGLGLIGLMQSLVATASAIAACGLGMAGTRRVAEAEGSGDPAAPGEVRRALVWGALVLAVAGGLLFWALRGVLAREVFDDPGQAGAVGWLALGVALSVAAGAQAALLNGMRRIGDIARMNVLSALLSTLAGIGALLAWGADAIVAFVLAAPLATWLLGQWYVRRLPRRSAAATAMAPLLAEWRALARMGAALMLSGLAGVLGQLLVRTLVQRGLGAEALGQFQAAWLVSMTYVGFVLGAMATDYYPRLTAAIRDPSQVNRMVNEQAEVALLLASPVFMAVLGLAPWLVRLLYTGEFEGAVGILRWQVLGDVLKLVSWPLSFILLAAGAGREYLATEVLAFTTFVVFTWLALPALGLQATGIGFLLMYALQLPVVYLLARRRTGFRWDRAVGLHALATLSCAAVVGLLAWVSQAAAAIAGVVFAAAFAAHGARRLLERLRQRPAAAPPGGSAP